MCSPPGYSSATACGVTLWGGSEKSSFLPRYFQGSQFTYQHIDLSHSMAMQAVTLASWGQAATFAGITFQPLMLGAAVNFWTCTLLLGNINPHRLKNQSFASKKHWEQGTVQQCETAQLAGGNNVYLMVSTICIYINLNEYFSYIHALN